MLGGGTSKAGFSLPQTYLIVKLMEGTLNCTSFNPNSWVNMATMLIVLMAVI